MKEPGLLVLSLDFELHWGGFEKWPIKAYSAYFDRTRRVIPRLLEAFAQSGVHCTWATVGILLHENRRSLGLALPDERPTYQMPALSAYHYIETIGIGQGEADDPYHYAASLVRRVLQTPGQELGTHTFAHYYCNEAGQTTAQFRADLQAARASSALHDIAPRSLVFPRNQFNENYLRVCWEEGIRVVRSNPVDWFWKIDSTQGESYWKRLNRGMSAYLPVGSKNTYALSSLAYADGLPLLLPASRLFRPYRPKEYALNRLKVRRIQAELMQAAQNGEVYHLWWHPHNFGHHPEENMAQLADILNTWQQCSAQYGMQAAHMGGVYDRVQQRIHAT